MPETGNRDPNSNTQALPFSRNNKEVYQTEWGEEGDTGQLCTVFGSSHYPVKIECFCIFAFFWNYEGLGLKFCQCLLQQDITCAITGAKQWKLLTGRIKIIALTVSLPITWLHLHFATVTPPKFHHLWEIHLLYSQFWLSSLAHDSFIFLFSSSFPNSSSGTMYLDPPSFSSSKKGVCGNS